MVDYNPRSWFQLLFRVQGSVLPHLIGRVLTTTAIAVFASYWHATRHIRMAATAHTLVGAALALLLVFRTNASYDRYWEGRKLLGALINRTRDLVRQTSVYVRTDDEEKRDVQRLLLLLFGLVRQYLRAERDLSATGVDLRPDELAALTNVRLRPAVVATWIAAKLAAFRERNVLAPEAFWLMDGNLTALVDAWGGAERIHKTLIPFAYAHHIKGLLTVFCFSVPFAMVESMGNFTPLGAAVVAYGLFGIEEIGIEIEDPFGYDPNDHPLDAMGQTLREDTTQLLAVGRSHRSA